MDASPPNPLFPVLYEDDRVLALHKPAGLVCHPTKTDVYSSLISRVRLHFEGRCEAHLIHRLDRETSGVLIVGKESDAARELRKLWELRRVTKIYLGIVHGWMEAPNGSIDAALGRDEVSEIAIKDCVRPDGACARTRFEVIERFSGPAGRFTRLRIIPETGRKHQIRIHLAHLGHPIVGDKMYGVAPDAYLAFVRGTLTSDQRRQLLLPWQALHAARLEFRWENEDRRFVSDAEPWFEGFSGKFPEIGA